MSEQVVIASRFRGPPESANGGYVSGLLAELVEAPAVQATLRLPPPLDRPLDVERSADGVRLLDDRILVAEAEPAELRVEPPPLPPLAEVEAAALRYPGLEHHPFPTCFVCGTETDPTERLGIAPGPLPDGGSVLAAPWTPPADLAHDSGELPAPIVWAALDCPTGWTHTSARVTALLGQMAARQLAPVRAGERYVVLAWPTGREGRRLFAESALFAEDGALAAVARTTWVRIDPDA